MSKPVTLSKSQINKAGKALRLYIDAQPDADPALQENAVWGWQTLVDWRAAHAVPLQSATMGLRSRRDTAQCSGEVSQRLKRIPTILSKLHREPGMALSRMADVGGCRAVLKSVDEVRRVQARYAGSGKVVRVKDYIIDPKASGYRAVHIIVEYSGRLIEVQLRTQVMHEWAVMVEWAGTRTNMDVKSGYGPPPVQSWFQAVSEAMAIEERGLTVSDILAERISDLKDDAIPYLRGRQP